MEFSEGNEEYSNAPLSNGAASRGIAMLCEGSAWRGKVMAKLGDARQSIAMAA